MNEVVERVTATIDEHTLAQVRRVAGPRGVSRFLVTVAKQRLARLDLLDELDAKHGARSARISAEVARDARRIFRHR